MTADLLWLEHEPRRMFHGEEPGLEMRFHDEWWHLIFETPKGFDVVLAPSGGGLGTFDDLDSAKRYAEEHARTAALSLLDRAQVCIRRAAPVLAQLADQRPGRYVGEASAPAEDQKGAPR